MKGVTGHRRHHHASLSHTHKQTHTTNTQKQTHSLTHKHTNTQTHPVKTSHYLHEPVVRSGKNILSRLVELDAVHGINPVPVHRYQVSHALPEQASPRAVQRNATAVLPAEPASARAAVTNNRRHRLRRQWWGKGGGGGGVTYILCILHASAVVLYHRWHMPTIVRVAKHLRRNGYPTANMTPLYVKIDWLS